MYLWYRLFTYLFYPFAPIYLYFRKIKKKEDLAGCKEKLSKIDKQRGEGFLIWFHVASIGEATSIFPLISNCEKEEKIDKILITSITLSSSKILKKKYKNSKKVIHQFLPLDIHILTNKFLNHWKPNLSIFIDSEIWPNLIFQINGRKIPLLLLNARITQKTFNRWRLLKNFAKKIFEKFDLCIASNKETENHLKILGAKNIKNYGNLKFSYSELDEDNKLDPLLINKIKDRKIWCAASTHPSEELICATSHIELKKRYANILTIIIPRHIDRIEKIEKELLSLNLNVALYNKVEKLNKDTDILLIDTYGESLKFYNITKYIFLGKSLVKSLMMDSGQNPLEAARYGCKIFHGPNVSNFKEIYDYLKNLNGTKEVANTEELTLSLNKEFEQEKEKNVEIAEKIQNYGQNILNNMMSELKAYINNYK
jgi:3-deoxy-D-manno-octulosonic-acid transferase